MKKLLVPAIAFLLLMACAKKQKTNASQANAYTLTVGQEKATGVVHANKADQDKRINLEFIYGTWTVNNDGPHADFKLTTKSLYIVDSEDGGDHEYTLSHDTLIVKYEDYNSIGIIKKAVKDTLVINWDNSADVVYVTWKG